MTANNHPKLVLCDNISILGRNIDIENGMFVSGDSVRAPLVQ
jgi:hypothetical protein